MSLYYYDTTAGTATITATATGWTSASLPVTVAPGALSTIVVSPASATIPAGGSQKFSAAGIDAYGNAVTIDPSWTSSLTGTFTPNTGPTTTFTVTSGASSGSSGLVTATVGTVSGHAAVTVSSLKSMSVTVSAGAPVKKGPNYHVLLTVSAKTSATTPIAGAAVAMDVFAGSTCSETPVATGTGTTNTNGTAAFTFTTRTAGTWCAQATVTATGYNPASAQATFST